MSADATPNLWPAVFYVPPLFSLFGALLKLDSESETGTILYPTRSFPFSEPSYTPEIWEL